ncbi:MAG: CPBP family intramembrane glutamic endopeptidase [Candidatus Acidiferrales bacterium]
MNSEPITGGPHRPLPDPSGGPLREHPMTSPFLGPHGLRVGWRLVVAISLWYVISGVLPKLLVWIPGVRSILRHFSISTPILTPAVLIFGSVITASSALLAALVMTRIEDRSFADYGLPGKSTFGGRFWLGAVYGFAMVSLLMGLIAALHGFSVHGSAIHGLSAASDGLLYFAGFIATAIFEEFAFRGYLQSTLQLAIGFWPAALILGAAFGAIHLINPGESIYGAVMAGCFGLLAAFTLWRSGNIWFAIGLHTAWDWGETFFYSVRDSGLPAAGHYLNSMFRGPVWLTGGSVGPEGSAIVFVVLALAAVGVHLLFPRSKQSR